jgi:hypothetical protein
VFAALQAGMVVLLGARLDGPPVDVQTRGATCDDADLEARIGHYLQTSSATTDGPTRVDAELVREESLWRLDLRVPQGSSVRTFRAASCATVIDAAAFVVAVAIDPTVAEVIDGPELSTEERHPQVPPADPKPVEHDPAEVSAPAPVARVEPSPPAVERRAPRITLGASAGIQGGTLPRVGALVRVEVGVLGQRWRADLRANVRTPSRARAEIDRGVGGRIGAWSIGARGCGLPVVRARALDIPLCAGFEAGQVFAQGFGFAGARSARLPWAAVTVGPALTWAMRPGLALVVTAEAGASLLGGALVIEGLQTVHRIGPVFGRGLVGLEGRFRGRSGA